MSYETSASIQSSPEDDVEVIQEESQLLDQQSAVAAGADIALAQDNSIVAGATSTTRDSSDQITVADENFQPQSNPLGDIPTRGTDIRELQESPVSSDNSTDGSDIGPVDSDSGSEGSREKSKLDGATDRDSCKELQLGVDSAIGGHSLLKSPVDGAIGGSSGIKIGEGSVSLLESRVEGSAGISILTETRDGGAIASCSGIETQQGGASAGSSDTELLDIGSGRESHLDGAVGGGSGSESPSGAAIGGSSDIESLGFGSGTESLPGIGSGTESQLGGAVGSSRESPLGAAIGGSSDMGSLGFGSGTESLLGGGSGRESQQGGAAGGGSRESLLGGEAGGSGDTESTGIESGTESRLGGVSVTESQHGGAAGGGSSRESLLGSATGGSGDIESQGIGSGTESRLGCVSRQTSHESAISNGLSRRNSPNGRASGLSSSTGNSAETATVRDSSLSTSHDSDHVFRPHPDDLDGVWDGIGLGRPWPPCREEPDSDESTEELRGWALCCSKCSNVCDDYLRPLSRRIRHSRTYTYILLILFVLPISEICMGSIYKGSCPMKKDLPDIVFWSGIANIAFLACCLFMEHRNRLTQSFVFMFFFKIPLVFIIGAVFVLLLLGTGQTFNVPPSFNPSDDQKYCAEVFYNYVYYRTCALLGFFGLALLLYVPTWCERNDANNYERL